MNELPSSPEVERASRDLLTDFIGLEELRPLREAQHRATLASLVPTGEVMEAAVWAMQAQGAYCGDCELDKGCPECRKVIEGYIKAVSPLLLAHAASEANALRAERDRLRIGLQEAERAVANHPLFGMEDGMKRIRDRLRALLSPETK